MNFHQRKDDLKNWFFVEADMSQSRESGTRHSRHQHPLLLTPLLPHGEPPQIRRIVLLHGDGPLAPWLALKQINVVKVSFKAHSHYCVFRMHLRQTVALLRRDRNFSISALTQSTAESADRCGECEWAFRLAVGCCRGLQQCKDEIFSTSLHKCYWLLQVKADLKQSVNHH